MQPCRDQYQKRWYSTMGFDFAGWKKTFGFGKSIISKTLPSPTKSSMVVWHSWGRRVGFCAVVGADVLGWKTVAGIPACQFYNNSDRGSQYDRLVSPLTDMGANKCYQQIRSCGQLSLADIAFPRFSSHHFEYWFWGGNGSFVGCWLERYFVGGCR